MAMGVGSASASSSTSNSSNAVYDTSRASISIPLVRSSIEQFVSLLSQYIESVQANQRLQLQQHQGLDGHVGRHRHHHHLHHDAGQVVAAGLPDGVGLGWREDDDVVHIQPLNEQQRNLLLAHDAHMATVPVVIPDYDDEEEDDDDQDETMMHRS
jgi:hypothetical protein